MPGPDDVVSVADPGDAVVSAADPGDHVTRVDGRPADGQKKGFWAEFGESTGGVTGLLTAPFRESIPIELVKGAIHDPETYAVAGVPGLIWKKFRAFLDSDDRKPLTQRMQETWHGLVSTAKAHPGLAVGSLGKGFAADPELFFLPGLGGDSAAAKTVKVAETLGAGAKTARAAGVIAGGATRVGAAAGIGGGAELAREVGEDQPFDPGQIGVSAAIGALAAPLQVPVVRRPKLSPAEIDEILSPAVAKGAAKPKLEVVPSAQGYVVRAEGEAEGRTFGTKAEAEDAAREAEAVASAHRVMETVPRGTSERARLMEDNPFTPEKMAEMVRRPKGDTRMTGEELARFWGKAAISAGIGAGIGAYLDPEDRGTGAAFGAVITLLPRALPKDRRLSIEDAINLRNGTLAVWARRTLQFKAAIDSAVPEPLRRNAISLALEGIPGVSLNPAEAKVAADVRAHFDAMGKTAVEAGVLKELLHDYVSHIVEENPEKAKGTISQILDALLKRSEGGGAQSGRQFAQHRKYPTFGELMAALRGSNLRIKTGDIGEIVAIYSKAMFRSITDKRLLDALKQTPAENMPPLVRAEPPKTGPPARQGGFTLPPESPPGAAAEKFAARDRMLLQPSDQADSTYVQLPNRQLAGYAVHRDIAPQLNFIFSARDPNDVILGLMALNQASKRAVVSFSLFHAKSLTDAFIGAMGTKAFNNPKAQIEAALKMFLRGGSNDGIDALLKHGLQLQPPEDITTDHLHSALTRFADVADKVLPLSAASAAARSVARFNHAIDQFTFGTLQTGFKIITGLDAYERLLKKGMPKEAAARMAASYANDIYGTLDWFRVANDVTSRIGRDVAYGFFNPNGRRWMQLLLFAPDWTLSTFRAAYKALPGATDDPALAALHRRYLAKSAVYYLTIANGINLITAGHSVFSNENPTRVQLGDGRTMQFSKHFMEPFEWLRDPVQTADNKMAFLPRTSVELGTGKEYVSAHDAAPDIKNRAELIARSFLPIYAQQGLAGGGAESALGLVGMPIYGKTASQKREAKLEKKTAEKEKRKKIAEYYQRQH
jgi:hypothetical protein